jgi:hypothetical protein
MRSTYIWQGNAKLIKKSHVISLLSELESSIPKTVYLVGGTQINNF